ncbi:MAG: hypothetical protein U9N34_08510, partial [Candidatus Cloacimonadota bacterium]|nr:hypothetical protein [Candidatus Cloacimonadota bacterium]
RLTALGYQIFLNSKSNYDIHGIGFDWAILPSNKTGFFEPKLSISTLSIMQDENPHQLLAFPTYLGFALNFLGESKINVKPSLGFVFIPYQYDGNINKSYGYSYGVSLLYWFKQNLGLGISYEKGENQINNEELIEQNLKSTEKIMIKMKYRLKDFDDFSDYEFGLDQLSAFRGENLNSNRFYLQGITYKPLSLMNKMKKNFLLPYVSFDKIKFLNKYSTANFDMLSANLGMQLIFGSDDTQFKFYSTFGWSPNWKSNNNNNILQTKSYSAKLGFSLNYQKYLLSRFLNLGIEYIKYFDVEELENNSNSYLDGFLLAKIGVNFHKIRPELSKISNRLINDFDFFIKLDKIYVDGFESKLGGGIAKYFDKHKSVIQEVSVSYSDFRKDKNKLSIYNLSYGIGASFFRDYSFDAIPIVKINWAPFMYDFDESYVLNDVDSKRKTVWDNFTWSYGVSFKTSFTKFGLTYGYERSKSLRGKYKINQSNKKYELISDSVKLGVFYIF